MTDLLFCCLCLLVCPLIFRSCLSVCLSVCLSHSSFCLIIICLILPSKTFAICFASGRLCTQARQQKASSCSLKISSFPPTPKTKKPMSLSDVLLFQHRHTHADSSNGVVQQISIIFQHFFAVGLRNLI